MDLGDRMKEYERAYDIRLPRRLPVILRIDGNHFSKTTKALKLRKPFDWEMRDAMVHTMRALLDYCSGAVLGYTQSDEISLLLRNNQAHTTEPMAGNRIQKLCSLVASEATDAFTRRIRHVNPVSTARREQVPVSFDCRVFVLPEDEVVNYFLWRQQDAMRNFILSACRWDLPNYDVQGVVSKMHGRNSVELREWYLKVVGDQANTIHHPGFEMGWSARRVQTEQALTAVLPENAKIPDGQDEFSTVLRSRWHVQVCPKLTTNRDYVGEALMGDHRVYDKPGSERLADCANLMANWGYDGEQAISPLAVSAARRFLALVAQEPIQPPFVAPVPDGGVQVEWPREDGSLFEVEFMAPDGSVLEPISWTWNRPDHGGYVAAGTGDAADISPPGVLTYLATVARAFLDGEESCPDLPTSSEASG